MTPAVLIALVALQLGGRLANVPVELTGPLEEVVLDAGPAGRTTIRAALAEGERWSGLAPVAVSASGVAASAEVAHLRPAGGRVELGAPLPAPERSTWRADRPVPAPPPARPHPAPAAGLVAAAAMIVSASLRRRPGRALAIGALGAALAGFLPPAGIDAQTVRVIDGDVDRDGDAAFVSVEASAGSLLLDPGARTDVATAPSGRALAVTVDLRGSVTRVRVAAPGGAVRTLQPLDPGARVLAADGNHWGDLQEAWVRSTAGAWATLGPWRAGEPSGPRRPGAPPGWLAAGLPMGVPVLIARPADGTWVGPGSAAASSWIRIVGPR